MRNMFLISSCWLVFSNILLAQNSLPFNSPSNSDTTVFLKTSFDNPYICPGKNEAYLYIDLQGSSMGRRLPLNLSVIFDRSGSMEGDRIHYAKLAMDCLIDRLQQQDILSIVMYDHEAEVLHGATPVYDKTQLKRKLHRIVPRGATNISGGLNLGYNEIQQNYDSTKINRMFLLTDGLANEGITNEAALEKIVKLYSYKNNTSLTTFGLGHEYNEVLLRDLADAGGGHYYHIGRPKDACLDFAQEMNLLQSVVAINTKLEIYFPSDIVEVAQVFGEHYTLNNGSVYIDLKEVHPNEQNGVLVKFKLKAPITFSVPITTRLVYNNVFTGNKTVQTFTSTFSQLPPNTNCDNSLDIDVMEKVAYYTSNHLVESAMKEAEKSNVHIARQHLNQSKKIIANGKPDSIILKNQLAMINQYESHLDKWNEKSPEDINNLHKHMRYHNYKLRKLKTVPTSTSNTYISNFNTATYK